MSLKEKVLELVKKYPGISTGDIAEKLEADLMEVHLTLKELEREGKIRKFKIG